MSALVLPADHVEEGIATGGGPVPAGRDAIAPVLPGRIETARLALRRPQANDADAIFAGLADPAVSRMLARVPYPYFRADAVEWLAAIGKADDGADDGANDGAITYAITRETDAAIGVLSVERHRMGNLHVGYWLKREAWGQGIMSEALRAALAAYFACHPTAVLRSGVFADNAASLRVQARLGFMITGCGDLFSVARGRTVSHIETMVDAAHFTPL